MHVRFGPGAAGEGRYLASGLPVPDQLGNTQAPVRLAGLYALERLAQDTPALRQTIVDVICAYLRMPYVLPEKEEPEREPGVPRAAVSGVTKPTTTPAREPHEEHQVRLTAQRILTDHLRYQTPPTHRWWQRRPADPNTRHWPDTRLDLTGATLIDLDLSDCRIGRASFKDAAFSGLAWFEHTTFFRGARFDRATFSGDAGFNGVAFSGLATFDRATFSGRASFKDAAFSGLACFEHTTFSGLAWFEHATFSGDAGFNGVAFSGLTRFDRATFSGRASFNDATFSNMIDFAEAAGLEAAGLAGARLAPVEGRVLRVLPSSWRAEACADEWRALRLTTPEKLGQPADDEGSSGGGS
ncbi:pentapeptide repeat-containing protein [Nonomuraea typhae]|uniref:Pentapeptide repeat-containing protein n=1 Tax=Nonomuraea typhae TaxID=2603600 RepID=A0ABW7ZA62_9ACTN